MPEETVRHSQGTIRRRGSNTVSTEGRPSFSQPRETQRLHTLVRELHLSLKRTCAFRGSRAV